jgi:hypothetical protein
MVLVGWSFGLVLIADLVARVGHASFTVGRAARALKELP